MRSSYFNTTGATGSLGRRREQKAKSQEELIYEYFVSRPGMEYSPSQVQRHLNLTGAPITSIRRAITNLTSANLLTKTQHQTRGPYDHPEYCWTLRVATTPKQGRLI